jgi:hypothetical protein
MSTRDQTQPPAPVDPRVAKDESAAPAQDSVLGRHYYWVADARDRGGQR